MTVPPFKVAAPVTVTRPAPDGLAVTYGIRPEHLDLAADTPGVIATLRSSVGIAEVHDRADGCARFELPPDRVGDVIVVAERHVVLGKSPAEHDLTLLREPLRSHGGVSEQTVPFVLNRPVSRPASTVGDLRNFDIFDWALNANGS